MANTYSEGDKLAMGSKAWVYVDMKSDSGSAAKRIGFVSQWSIRKTMQTSEARVVGELVPVSIDITGISTEVSLSGFIPTIATQNSGEEAKGGGNGASSLKYFNPDTSKILSNSTAKIPYLCVKDDAHDREVLSYAKWLTPTSYSESGSAQDYIKCDVSLKGIESDNGTNYKEFTTTTSSS